MIPVEVVQTYLLGQPTVAALVGDRVHADSVPDHWDQSDCVVVRAGGQARQENPHLPMVQLPRIAIMTYVADDYKRYLTDYEVYRLLHGLTMQRVACADYDALILYSMRTAGPTGILDEFYSRDYTVSYYEMAIKPL